MTPDAVRALVAKLPDTAEGAHHGHPDFRVRNKIFATLTARTCSKKPGACGRKRSGP
jgi:hypothetical protein